MDEVDGIFTNIFGSNRSQANTSSIDNDEDSDDQVEYPMKGDPMGLCLIFNNDFKNEIKTGSERKSFKLQHRPESRYDVNRIKHLFSSSMKFTVNEYNNLSKNKMEETLQDAARKNNQTLSCLVVFILSHGLRDYKDPIDQTHKHAGVFMSDGEFFPILDILKIFYADNCKIFKEKPKLFFVQASKPQILTLQRDSTESIASPRRDLLPVDSDIYVLSSPYTKEETYGERDGTIFIKMLCEIFEKKSKEEYFNDLVLLLKKNLKQKVSSMSGIFDSDTLRSKIKFF